MNRDRKSLHPGRGEGSTGELPPLSPARQLGSPRASVPAHSVPDVHRATQSDGTSAEVAGALNRISLSVQRALVRIEAYDAALLAAFERAASVWLPRFMAALRAARASGDIGGEL